MKFSLLSFLIQSLTYFTFTDVSQATPLIGPKVRNAFPREFPSVVSIGKRRSCNWPPLERAQYCTGTLITSRHVITAAHCLFGLNWNDTVVIAGDANLYRGKSYRIKKWITFDEWHFGAQTEEFSYNDVAIITLRKSVTNVEPARVQISIAKDLYESRLRIAGWGSSADGKSPKVLKTAIVHTLTNEKCDELLASMTNEPSNTSEDYFCSKVEPYVLSSCGDSGAPLFDKRGQLVGINLGVCPPSGTLCHYPKKWVCQHQLNLHLHLQNYQHFIRCLTFNDKEACKLTKKFYKMEI